MSEVGANFERQRANLRLAVVARVGHLHAALEAERQQYPGEPADNLIRRVWPHAEVLIGGLTDDLIELRQLESNESKRIAEAMQT